MRLAFIVSHPIQYYVPIYRDLAKRIRQVDERQPSGARQVASATNGLKDEARISGLKVFYTWRDAGAARDVRFGKTFAWDIPLMEGYDFEVVPNTSPDPGTHHRQGLINPDLVARVKAWKPDAVHITGYNYVSHGQAIKELSEAGIPLIFRGDSHLLDGLGSWWKWWIKKSWLSRVYSRPQGFAYVGQNNRDYYRAFGVPERKLFPVPHTIEVGRFAEPHEELESKALAWRRELGIPDDHFVFLYAAKLEPRKRPMELLEAFLAADLPKTTLLFVGSGELERALKEKAAEFSHGLTRIDTDGVRAAAPTGLGGECSRRGIAYGPSTAKTPSVPGARKAPSERTDDGQPSPVQREETGRRSDQPILSAANSRGNVVFLEFQNQSVMPMVYRLGDALVLPSGYWETWGLAVNEAQACGRPSLVSDCVGCARDIVREGENGAIFRTDDWEDCVRVMRKMANGEWRSKREAIRAGSWGFDTARGVEALLSGLRKI
jgi:glycosyltransferase involved in cell wall biosynthesis